MNIDRFKYIGEFKLKSGKISKEYWDFRPLILYPYFISRLADVLRKYTPCNIIGVDFWGAVMLAKIITIKGQRHINPIIYRSKKGYGLDRQEYGEIDWNLHRTYILDDVVSTGGTMDEVVEHFRQIMITGILCMLDRTGNIHKQFIKQNPPYDPVSIPIIELSREL